jgi:hypothetical protein
LIAAIDVSISFAQVASASPEGYIRPKLFEKGKRTALILPDVILWLESGTDGQELGISKLSVLDILVWRCRMILSLSLMII